MTNGMSNLGGQQIIIVPEGTLRNMGRDAQRTNIMAAKAVSDAVRTTLGPKGMDKMLVNSMGDVIITNDGATILQEMQIEHPAAKMMVEVAKTQDEEVGDGTTTAVVLAGEMLKKAGDLLDMNIHPSVITRGFSLAKTKAMEVLESQGKAVSLTDDQMLENIAITAMTGKSSERASQELAMLAIRAIKRVAEKNSTVRIDTDNIKIEKKQGGSMSETVLIDGILVDKEVVHSGMPKKVENAKILLLESALEIKNLENDAKVSIDSPDKLQAFMMQEEKQLKEMADNVIKTGATVVLCQKGIDDMVQHYLAKATILAGRRVKKSDMDALARATGGKVVSSLKDIGKTDLGFAGLVEERKVAGEQMIFVEKCKDPKAVTILIRGGTEHVVDEVQRAMTDAVKGMASALELGKVVAGGGAVEIELAREVRKYAETLHGREQLAVMSFADAMEVIPRSLAENAGMDPIDKIAALRAAHDKGQRTAGLDVFTGEVVDSLKAGVVEPLKTKMQALKSASEATEMILRIDDVISASGKGRSMPQGMGGMPPGMGGME